MLVFYAQNIQHNILHEQDVLKRLQLLFWLKNPNMFMEYSFAKSSVIETFIFLKLDYYYTKQTKQLKCWIPWFICKENILK